MITVVGLGNGMCGSLTLGALEALKSGSLLLQTRSFALCAYLEKQGISFATLDEVYEQAEDFDGWAQACAGLILRQNKQSGVVLGVLGDGSHGTLVKLLGQSEKLSIVPGPSLGSIAMGMCGFTSDAGFAEVFAQDAQRYEPNGLPVVVSELDHTLKASQAKLFLSEYYGDETPIDFVDTQSGKTEKISLFELDRQKAYSAFCTAVLPALCFEEKKRYGFADLVSIIDRLRAPGGCPWDREQTHESMKKCLLEETYEVFEAIDEKDDDKLYDELGDVLLQVVFHSCIAKEQGRFTDRDVTTSICKKMISRHTHVFGGDTCKTADDVIENWEKIKKAEKQQKEQSEVLSGVPKALPALVRSYKVQQKAAAVGFDWDNAEDAFFKIGEETQELHEQMLLKDEEKLFEELGDLLFAVVNVSRKLKIQPEFALQHATEKFIARFTSMEQLSRQNGESLETMNLEQMDALWNQIKTLQRV